MPECKIFKRKLTEQQAELLQKQFIDESYIDMLITYDCDGYDVTGNMLFKFRKNVIPIDILKLGVDSFKDSIRLNDGRGAASGFSGYKTFKGKGVNTRGFKIGDLTNVKMGNYVHSGNVGYKDRDLMTKYCRLTSFTKNYFEKFQQGIPFILHIDGLYATLCPDHYIRQRAIADATNRNYVIANTSFTTVTVNKNFRTAVHKDSGDFMQGFGNLCCYRQGHYEGCYFCLPEYGVGFDLHNGDMLFVDVHKWHGNTDFKNADPDFLRISFVMYYRENMIDCKQPSAELERVKHITGNFFKI
jgi:hypothetical protein